MFGLIYGLAHKFLNRCDIKYPNQTYKYFSLLDKEISKMAKQKCRDSKRVSLENKERLKLL